MKEKPKPCELTPKSLAKIREIVQYEAVKPLKERIKVLERKVDYMSGKLMFKKITIEP